MPERACKRVRRCCPGTPVVPGAATLPGGTAACVLARACVVLTRAAVEPGPQAVDDEFLVGDDLSFKSVPNDYNEIATPAFHFSGTGHLLQRSPAGYKLTDFPGYGQDGSLGIVVSFESEGLMWCRCRWSELSECVRG